jgi:hypothetical protein
MHLATIANDDQLPATFNAMKPAALHLGDEDRTTDFALNAFHRAAHDTAFFNGLGGEE